MVRKKMDGELLLPGEQLQNKTLNAAEGGETLRQLKEMLLTPSINTRRTASL